MNHLLIITTCFQNTLASFLNRHLAIIKSFGKQKLDLAPNTRPSLPIPSTWSGNDIILSRGRGAAGLQNKLSIQLRSHTVSLFVCEDFRRFCWGLLQILRIPHTQEWVIFDDTPTICGEFGYVYEARPWKHSH